MHKWSVRFSSSFHKYTSSVVFRHVVAYCTSSRLTSWPPNPIPGSWPPTLTTQQLAIQARQSCARGNKFMQPRFQPLVGVLDRNAFDHVRQMPSHVCGSSLIAGESCFQTLQISEAMEISRHSLMYDKEAADAPASMGRQATQLVHWTSRAFWVDIQI